MLRRTFLKLSLAACALPLVGEAAAPVVGFRKPSGAWNRSLLLSCIVEIESGGDDTLVGPCGERSKYQFTYPVWLQHAKGPIQGRDWFEQWCNGAMADALAQQHMDWIVRSVGTNPFAVVASWHLGVEGARRTWSPRARDHINRTLRIYRLKGGA